MAKNLQTNISIGGKLLPSLANAFSQASMGMNKVSAGAKHAAISSRLAGNSVATTVAKMVGITSIGAGLAYVGKKGLEGASDLVEVQNVVDVTFGNSTDQINAWSKAALNAFGLTELQAEQFTGTMGAMLKSSGLTAQYLVPMSKNIAGLAGDVASFYNLPHDQAWEKIRSGMSGETEPLKQLGINMSVANLEAYALSKGIKTSYQNMNQATQTALRYSYLMSVTKDVQGDFARTQASFSNQQRLSKSNLDKLTSTLANKFLPYATKGYALANKFISGINTDVIIAKFDNFITTMGNAFAYVSPYISWLINMGLPQLRGTLQDAFVKAQPYIVWTINTGLPLVKAGIQGAFDIASKMYNFVNDNWSQVEPIVWGIVGAVVAYRGAMWGLLIAQKAGMIITALSKAWSAAVFVIEWMRAGLSLVTLAQWALNAAFAANPIGVVVVAIGLLVAGIILLVKHWDWLKEKVVQVWNMFTGFIQNLPDWALIFSGPIAPILFLIKHFDKIKDGALSAINAIKGFFKFGNGGKTVADTNFDTSIGHNATGTNNWRGGWTWLGEQGPELVNLPGGSQVIPNNRATQIAGGGMPNIQIIVNVQGGDSDAYTRAKTGVQAAIPDLRNALDEYFGNQRRLSYG